MGIFVFEMKSEQAPKLLFRGACDARDLNYKLFFVMEKSRDREPVHLPNLPFWTCLELQVPVLDTSLSL